MKQLLLIMLLASCSLRPKEPVKLGAEWTKAGTAGFTPRRNFGLAVEGDELYVVGGFTKDVNTLPLLVGDVWYSGDGGKSWTEQTPRAAFPRRQDFALVMFRGELYVIGGYGEAGVLLDDVWKSSDKGRTWIEVAASAGFGVRYGHGAEMLNGELYVIGGRTASSKYNDIWKTRDGIRWTLVSTSAPFRGRDGFGLMVYKGEFLLVGGYGDIPLTDLWHSENGGQDWYKLRNAPFEFWQSGFAGNNGDLFVAEGANVWRSNDGAESWEKLVFDAPYGEREGFGLVSIDKKLLLIGGRDKQSGEYLNDIWQSKY